MSFPVPEPPSLGNVPRVDLSLVCAPSRYAGDLVAIHNEFHAEVVRTGRSAEFLYVLNGSQPRVEEQLRRLSEPTFPIRVIRMPRGYDEAAGLQYAFEQARGQYVITVPDRFQIDPSLLPALIGELDGGADVVLTRREPRTDALFNRIQSALFHLLIRGAYDQKFRDLSCGMRGLTSEAARKLDLYGDLHRFIPILAARKGFRIRELPGRQRREDHNARLFSPGVYARRLLDVLHLFFLTRFTSKPLRFFGMIGLVIGSIGAVICAVLGFNRVFGDASIADRPLLLLGVLMLLLGVQIISTGLIGEIIIFFSADRDRPEVEEIEP
jgi:dolichol-phosphate mannosyltransferase